MIVGTKLNSIESKISEGPMNIMKLVVKTLWELLMKKNCRKQYKNSRMMKSQKRDTEKNNLIEENRYWWNLLHKMKLLITV